MQQPTCKNVRIRSTNDAHKIFRAVQEGILHMVTRRLDADERLALRSGCIYAWEERGPHSEITGLGIERFTEGRRWSPSRVRDEFLFYYEKYSPPPDASQLGNAQAERQPPRDWDPLVKQTYSVWVETEKGRRKWHLTAYFTQATFDQLGTVDDDPRVRDLVFPDGTFKSTRVGKSRNKTDDHARPEPSKSTSANPSRTYAPFPSPYQYNQQHGSPSLKPVLMHEPYRTSNQTSQHDYPEGQSQSSTYNQSPSPISPQSHGPFLPHQGTFPGSSPSTGYLDTHYSNSPNPSSRYLGSTYQTPYQQSIQDSDHVRLNHLPYASPRSLPSWNNGEAIYQNPAEPVHSNHTRPSPTFSGNMAYPGPLPPGQSNGSDSPHPYSPHSPNPQANHLYSPSYSLHSGLLPTQSISESRAPLSPLQIPERMTSAIFSPQSANGEIEGDQVTLAPLDVLKRQSHYRRAPQDEKVLRLLRPPQTTP